VVDPKVPAQLRVTNGTDTGSWAAVLAVLRGNGLAAFTAGGITNVVPGSNALLVVDRYANTRRLIATLREMDKPPAR